MTYYDSETYRKADCMVITRSCAYTTPELQHLMTTDEFEAERSEMFTFYRLSKEKGLNVEEAVKVLGDNPFLPGDLETLAGRSSFTLQSRKVRNTEINLPISESGQHVGKMRLKFIFKTGKNIQQQVDLDTVINSNKVEIQLQVLGVEFFNTKMKNVFLVYSFIGSELRFCRSTEKELSTKH
eukprot:UN32895